MLGIITVPVNKAGLVYKKGFGGSKNKVSITNGVGYQADLLYEGKYFGYSKLRYEVKFIDPIIVETNEIALVIAKDGQEVENISKLGKVVNCDNFQDAKAFLENGGEIGEQLHILTKGEYFINPQLFQVIIKKNAERFNYPSEWFNQIEVKHDEIALIIAKKGKSVDSNIGLGKVVECNNFQNAHLFIENGGERGKQLDVLSAGQYAINPLLFQVITTKNMKEHHVTSEMLKRKIIGRNKVGIVNILVGKENDYNDVSKIDKDLHQSYQKAQVFFDKGGYRGIQEEVITSGEYVINPWFAEVREVDITIVPTGTVGIVVAHTGKKPIDSNNIGIGERGIWTIPLKVGKHPINIETKTIRLIPTNEISLKWGLKEGKSEDNYDRDLEPIELGTKDGYKITLEVVQTIQIREKDAPKLISQISENESMNDINSATIGNKKYPAIRNLINRKIQSQIESYFTSIGQQYNAIDFRDKKDEIQLNALVMIDEELNEYGVEAKGLSIKIIEFPDVIDSNLRKKAEYHVDRVNLVNDLELENMEMSAKATNNEIEALGRARIEEIEDKIKKAKEDATLDIKKQEVQLEIAKKEAIINAYGKENYLEMERMKALAEVKFPEYSRMDMSEFLLTEFYTSRGTNLKRLNEQQELSTNELKKIANDKLDTDIESQKD